jgi:hypothetical protein
MSPKLFHLAAAAAAILITLSSPDARGQSDPPPLPGAGRVATPVPISGQGGSRPAPLPIIDECRCSSTVFDRSAGGGVVPRLQTTFVTEEDGLTGTAPRDTCPGSSTIDIQWHSEPHGATGYRYRLGEPPFLAPPFILVGPGVTSLAYDGASLSSGVKVFTLGARDPAGAYRDVARRFQLDYPPDTWWSGPDLGSPSLVAKPNGERYAVLVAGQLPAPGVVGSLFSPESTLALPASRPERSTFFEIWKDTVYARQEGDTVHMNSWVVFHGGGFDRDSPYRVRVTDLARQLPGFPGGPVLEPGPANGSPIGFRSIIFMSITPGDRPSITGFSGMYPLFDPADAFHLPRIAGYHPAFQAGRAFALMQALDGNGGADRRVEDARELVLRIENGTATPVERALRSKVLTFYVDRAPYFVTDSPDFRPGANQTFTTSQWSLRLIANDDDPFQPGAVAPGGPSAVSTLRRKISVHGKDLQGNDFTYVDPNVHVNQADIIVSVPAALAAGPCVIEVELCDCAQCEDMPGSGRCVVSRFPVMYQPSGPAAGAAAAAAIHGPATTLLFTPYPNPTSRAVTFRFGLAVAGVADLELYNLAGQRVRQLTSDRLPAGEHTRIWDGRDEEGRPVAAGIYLVRLRTREVLLTRKVFVAP